MVRLFALGLPLAAAALVFATPAAAEPCQDSMAGIEYALAIATGEAPASNVPDICIEKCNEKCDYLGSQGSWADCYYPCMKACGGIP